MPRPSPAVAAVRTAVRRSLADLECPRVLVGCSGGADSLALAAAVGFLHRSGDLTGAALTVDHGLQEGSDTVAEAAADLCVRLGLPDSVVRRVTVGHDGGPEAAARTARSAALEQQAAQTGADAVLLAHTMDDQAETVLLGLARGSGARSLAGMPARRGPVRRPLLELPRELVRQAAEAALADIGLGPQVIWSDPHNSDPRYRRVVVRDTVLPVLERTLGPGVAAALARTGRLLGEDAEVLDHLAADALRCATVPQDQAGLPEDLAETATRPGGTPDPVLILRVEALTEHPAAIRRRVLLAAARSAGASASALGHRHALAMDRLVTGWHGQEETNLPSRVVVVRRCGKLLFVRTGSAGTRPSHTGKEPSPIDQNR